MWLGSRALDILTVLVERPSDVVGKDELIPWAWPNTLDTALCWGPGLRWGVMGQVLLSHLGGRQGGMEHFLQQFTGPMTAWWKTLRRPN